MAARLRRRAKKHPAPSTVAMSGRAPGSGVAATTSNCPDSGELSRAMVSRPSIRIPAVIAKFQRGWIRDEAVSCLGGK